ncbi:hypothetical protein K8R51_32100 [Rhizobium favelukesii]|nr:hypothetical protein [Rhizobium favelukesii]
MIDDGGRFGGMTRRLVVGEKRSNAFAVQATDLDGAGGDGLGPIVVDVAKQAQDTQACSKALFGVRAAGKDCADQTFCLGTDGCGPAPKAIWCPLSVSPVGTGHVIWVGSMTRAAIAALMGGDALAAVKDLDGARRCPQIDLLANEGMGDGIKEAFELDVIIGRDTDQTPFGEFVVFTRKAGERSTFDTLK